MENKVLSMFPYYGGKARMAPLICDMLDYEHTDIFVTPFGGACRVLLNKPRHAVECYGDLSVGLCTFVELMSKKETAIELIHRIYDTEYSQVQFDWAKDICYLAETPPLTRMEYLRDDCFKNLLIEQGFMSKHQSLTTVLKKDSNKKEPGILQKLKDKVSSRDLEQLKAYQNEIKEINDFGERNGYIPLSRDYVSQHITPKDKAKDIGDIDLAVATYVRFMQSRDAMGQVWSNAKFKTQDDYYKQMARLYDVADRLEGVITFQRDAKYFYTDYVKTVFNWEQDWLSNPNVMMCCDPSYIDPVSERKYLDLLEDVKNGKITKEQAMKKRPKNLGGPYVASFTYEDHEAFVKEIYQAKCKMIVCNYDLVLYNTYLNAENGWKRLEFETTTSVGGKKDNMRTEVLWYNY